MPTPASRLHFKVGSARIPAWAILALLIISGAGAVTGLLLQDSVNGYTTIGVSQAILVDYTQFDKTDVVGDADEVLVSVSDDGSQWRVHIEANNGDLITIYLPVANEATQNIVAELHLAGSIPDDCGSYSIGASPIYYWSDKTHDDEYTGGTWGEAVIDQRATTDKLKLERGDLVKSTGTADFDNFTANHWFFDGSYTAPGTYGYGGIYGPAYNDNIFSNYDGEDPEAILLDGNTIGELDPGLLDGTGDTIVTEGRAALYEDLGSYAIGRLLYYDTAGAGWTSGDDIFVSVDGDAYYSTMADVLLDADGSATLDAGAAAAISVGDALRSFDTDDDIYYYDAAGGDIFDGASDALFYDDADDGLFAASGGSVSANTAATTLASTLNPGFDIAVDGGLATDVLLENSGEIVGGDLSTIGLQSSVAWADGSVLHIGGNNYILTDSTVATAASTMEVIGHVTIGGDSLKGTSVTWPTTLTHVCFIAILGSRIDEPITLAQSIEHRTLRLTAVLC